MTVRSSYTVPTFLIVHSSYTVPTFLIVRSSYTVPTFLRVRSSYTVPTFWQCASRTLSQHSDSALLLSYSGRVRGVVHYWSCDHIVGEENNSIPAKILSDGNNVSNWWKNCTVRRKSNLHASIKQMTMKISVLRNLYIKRIKNIFFKYILLSRRPQKNLTIAYKSLFFVKQM